MEGLEDTMQHIAKEMTSHNVTTEMRRRVLREIYDGVDHHPYVRSLFGVSQDFRDNKGRRLEEGKWRRLEEFKERQRKLLSTSSTSSEEGVVEKSSSNRRKLSKKYQWSSSSKVNPYRDNGIPHR